MKIAIYGGAFNPIHNGHIGLALSLNKKYQFDKIILIPTGNPVHKSDENFISAIDRLNMCKLVSQENKIFEVSDIETKCNEKSYTYNTVQKLKKIYPQDDFYLIIGGDMLLIFDTWYKYKLLANEVKVICGAREDNFKTLAKKVDELKKENCIVNLEEIPINCVSSSEIRQKLKFNQNVNKLLPGYVLEYIKERKLYEE